MSGDSDARCRARFEELAVRLRNAANVHAPTERDEALITVAETIEGLLRAETNVKTTTTGRKFIVIVESGAVAQIFREQGAGWARFSNVWFVTDVEGRTMEWWRGQVEPLARDEPYAIFEVETRSWAVRSAQAFRSWMKTVWEREDNR